MLWIHIFQLINPSQPNDSYKSTPEQSLGLHAEWYMLDPQDETLGTSTFECRNLLTDKDDNSKCISSFFDKGTLDFKIVGFHLRTRVCVFVITLIAWTNKNSPDKATTSSTTSSTFNNVFNILNCPTIEPVFSKKEMVLVYCTWHCCLTCSIGKFEMESVDIYSCLWPPVAQKSCKFRSPGLHFCSVSSCDLETNTSPWHSLTDSSVNCTGV